MELSLAQTEDPFRREIETTVEAVEPVDAGEGGWRVRLAETVFYPEGGGQPSDTGTLGGADVLEVGRDDAGRIWHVTDAEPHAPGDEATVTARIDWSRRFDHMQQHTAQHLITALADDAFGMPTTSFHLGDQHCSVDLRADSLGPGKLAELEERVNAEIRRARPVAVEFVDPEEYRRMDVRSRGLPDEHSGRVRLIVIDGVDRNTCGGTHVTNTAQLQAITLTGAEASDGSVRVSYLAGGRVRERLDGCLEREAALKERLSCGADEHVEAVERAQSEAQAAERQVRRYREELAELLGGRLGERDERVVALHRDETDFQFLGTIARTAREADDTKIVFVTAAERGEHHEGIFLIAGPEDVIDTVGDDVAERLDGRGGGPPGVYQGKAGRVDRREEVTDDLREKFTSN